MFDGCDRDCTLIPGALPTGESSERVGAQLCSCEAAAGRVPESA